MPPASVSIRGEVMMRLVCERRRQCRTVSATRGEGKGLKWCGGGALCPVHLPTKRLGVVTCTEELTVKGEMKLGSE